MKRTLTMSFALLASALLVGCGSDAASGGSGGAVTCPGSQQYDSINKKCVDKPADAGGLSDAASSSGSDSSSGSGSSSGGADVEGELPWQLADGGGIIEPDTGDNYINTCPQTKGATGAHSGQKCEKHEDCMYGFCFAGGFLAAYDSSIKFCARNVFCSGGGNCSDENDGSNAFTTAFEKSKSGGNPKRTSASPYKICTRTCKSDSECAAWNPQLPHCLKTSTSYVSIGAQGACAKDPDK